MGLIISWRYSQKIEILEYDLFREVVKFKVLDCGANFDNFEEGKIYKVSFSDEDRVPDIARVIELIEEQHDIYLCD